MVARCAFCGKKISERVLSNAARVGAVAEYCGQRCRNAAKQARHRRQMPVSAQDRIHLRNLAAHGMIAEKILRDPMVIRIARENIERWVHERGPSPAYSEWLDILAQEPRAVAAALVAVDEDAMRRRSSSPFVNILGPEERDLVYTRLRKR